jgi:hypothetical protein
VGLYGDKLTKSAGTPFDGLTKSAGTPRDNLLYAAPFDNLIKNSFDWSNAIAGLAADWFCSLGSPSIVSAEDFTGNAQKVIADNATGIAHLYQPLGGIIDGVRLKLKFKGYMINSVGVQPLRIYQGSTLITVLYAPDTIYSVDVDFTASKMSDLIFDLSSDYPDYFIIDEVELYAI